MAMTIRYHALQRSTGILYSNDSIIQGHCIPATMELQPNWNSSQAVQNGSNCAKMVHYVPFVKLEEKLSIIALFFRGIVA